MNKPKSVKLKKDVIQTNGRGEVMIFPAGTVFQVRRVHRSGSMTVFAKRVEYTCPNGARARGYRKPEKVYPEMCV